MQWWSLLALADLFVINRPHTAALLKGSLEATWRVGDETAIEERARHAVELSVVPTRARSRRGEVLPGCMQPNPSAVRNGWFDHVIDHGICTPQHAATPAMRAGPLSPPDPPSSRARRPVLLALHACIVADACICALLTGPKG